jgi:LuxR family glucitol operon transcriptional activator
MAFFADMLSNALGQLIGEVFGETLERKLDRRMMLRELNKAVTRAEERFAREHRAQDAEIADALTTQTRFADLPSVRAALRELLTRPFHDPAQAVAALRQSFDDVLSEQVDRARVEAAVMAFLACLGQEVLYIPQLRELYTLYFQKLSAESSRSVANHAAALIQGMQGLRDDIRLLGAAPAPVALLSAQAQPAERPRPWHNLPQRSYTHFVGRQAELAKLTELLLPHPRSRHFVVTLDGIGGVGKSALALELAYCCRDGYAALPEAERFDAIVWVSAKRTLLTGSGIQQRQQTFTTLNDLYREIATVLEQPGILQADANHRRGLVNRALSAQRTLLIVDNLETVDDEELLVFLREIPDPTKVIVTTRHRIDIAYAIRLSGMPRADALELMEVEAGRKGVELPSEAMDDLYRRSGGVPLAIVWSIGLMSMGHSVESVLRRLGSGHSDIARFCFAESVAGLRQRDPERLLFALALFERSVNRQMLGEVAGLGDDAIGRDDGLAELLRLSLIDQKSDRFKLLPLTHSFARDQLARRPELERELRERWIIHLCHLARQYAVPYWDQPDRRSLWSEGAHFLTLAVWARQQNRLDLVMQILPALASSHNLADHWDDIYSLSLSGIEYARLTENRPQITFIATHLLAWALNWRRRFAEAERYLDEALAVAYEDGNVLWQCEVLQNYAKLLRLRRAFDLARERCQEVVALLPQIAEPRRRFLRADIAYELGKIARDQQDWEAAKAHFVAASDVYRVENNPPMANVERYYSVLSNLAYILHQQGDLEGATQLYRQAYGYYHGAGSKGIMAKLLLRMAILEQGRGDHLAALEHAREAIDWSRKLGMVQEQAQAEVLLSRLGPQSS